MSQKEIRDVSNLIINFYFVIMLCLKLSIIESLDFKSNLNWSIECALVSPLSQSIYCWLWVSGLDSACDSGTCVWCGSGGRRLAGGVPRVAAGAVGGRGDVALRAARAGRAGAPRRRARHAAAPPGRRRPRHHHLQHPAAREREGMPDTSWPI